jgi:hypothetical protein
VYLPTGSASQTQAAAAAAATTGTTQNIHPRISCGAYGVPF